MKILLLGVGLQGKAVLYDLMQSENITEIVAADWDFERLQAHVEMMEYGQRVRCEYVDASDKESVVQLFSPKPDIIISLLPKTFLNPIALIAVEFGINLVFTSYTTPEIKALGADAEKEGITILPEFGMDPGIDLVLLGEAVRSLDQIDEINTYGAGFPELKAANNPLGYKVTWTFEGVLLSYRRAGRIIRDGQVMEFPDTETFNLEHTHEIEIDGLGVLEAFPNGDAIKYANLLGVKTEGLHNLGRYVLRWPGHCAFWKKMVDLGFLDDAPLLVDGVPVDRKKFLVSLLEPQLQYIADERDVVVVRIDVTGTKDGQKKRLIYQIIDYRDLETGFTSMNRTVGYTASIGAQMIGNGEITKKGLLSPVNDVPYDLFVRELKKRDIHITYKEIDL